MVLGLVPGIAVAREQLRGRSDVAAKIGFVMYLLRRLARARRIAVEIAVRDGGTRVERVHSIAVANNDYDEGVGQVFSRSRLDGGTLSLYVLRHLGVTDAVRLTAEMLAGRWREDSAIEIENVDAVTLRMLRRSVKVMIDGEVRSMHIPLRFRIRPGVLSVLSPVPATLPAETAAGPGG